MTKVVIDGIAYELCTALLGLVSCSAQIAEISLLLTDKQEQIYWLNGTADPAPQTLDRIVFSRLQLGLVSVEDLFARLTGTHDAVIPTKPGGIVMRAQRQGPTTLYLTASFDYTGEDGVAANTRRASFEVIADLVSLNVGIPL